MTRMHVLRQQLPTYTGLALIALNAVVFLVGVRVWFPRLQEVCLDTPVMCQQRLQLTPAQIDALLATGWTLAGRAWFHLLYLGGAKLLGLAIGALLLWRRPNDRMAWVAALYLMIGGDGSVFDSLADAQPAWWLPTRVLSLVALICLGLFFCLFPTGRFVPRWVRWLALAWGAKFFFTNFFPGTPLDEMQWNPVLTGVVNMLLVGGFLWAQIHRYRSVSDATQRQQTKWVVFAAALGAAAMVGALAVILRNPVPGLQIGPYWLLFSLAFGSLEYLLPVAIGIAILRYHLWDIDVIIRRTLVYSLVTLLLALVYFGAVVLLQSVFEALTGQNSPLAVVASTLAIAALFTPLRRWVQDIVDRRFYRRRYNARQVLDQFAATVRDETDIGRLEERLVAIVEETMQPAHASVWLRADTPGQRRPTPVER